MTSTRDRLEAALARIPERENVFTRVYEAQARAAADAADARRKAGVTLGPLDGAIVSVKDLFDVAGETTLAGSRVLGDRPPAAADAPVVARLRRAGAVIVGRTNMVEFAFSGLGLNPHTGTPGNAVDPSLIPGGSSSGAGVSAALGTSEIAIGTDTGGSVRIPASLNGVVGFKPTARRVPLAGAFPLSYSLDSIGPLAPTVRACQEADAAMAGEEPWRLEPASLAGLSVGVARGMLLEDTEDAVADGFERSLARLERAGARIVEHRIDDLLAAIAEATSAASIAAVEAAEIHGDHLDSHGALFDPQVIGRILRGRNIPAPAYIRMMRRRTALCAAMDTRLREIGVLALPATPAAALPITPLLEDDEAYARANLLMLRNTMPGNLFDLCAVSLPMPGMPRPAGLMLMARHGEDRRLLAVAAAAEAALAR